MGPKSTLACMVLSAATAFMVASFVVPSGMLSIGPRVVHADMIVVDRESKPGKIIISDMGGPDFFMYDGTGTARVGLSMTPIGAANLNLNSADGSTAINLQVTPTVTGTELIVQADGERIFGVRVATDGTVQEYSPSP